MASLIRRYCARSSPAPLITLCNESRLHDPTLRETFRTAGTGGGRPDRRAHIRAGHSVSGR
jgi:hypothetical protein